MPVILIGYYVYREVGPKGSPTFVNNLGLIVPGRLIMFLSANHKFEAANETNKCVELSIQWF